MEGAFIYNPGDERERAVEIQGEDDYPKFLTWYRRGMHEILRRHMQEWNT
jgi:hypothetical protein